MTSCRTAAVIVVLTAHIACAVADPDVILSLDGQQVRRSEFEQHVAEVGRRAEGLTPNLREALLAPFLEERVLVLRARAQGLVTAGAGTEAEKIAVEALLSKSLSAAEVTEEEIARYYAAHPESFRRPDAVTISQILLPTENEARDVRRRLQGDPKSFEILARSRSRSPEASTGGLMGTFEPGQLPSELESATFSLPVGGTSAIVQSPLGYHVLRVDARTVAREEPLDACRTQIRTLLVREKNEAATRVFVQNLLSRAKVNHEAALRESPRS